MAATVRITAYHVCVAVPVCCLCSEILAVLLGLLLVCTCVICVAVHALCLCVRKYVLCVVHMCAHIRTCMCLWIHVYPFMSVCV